VSLNVLLLSPVFASDCIKIFFLIVVLDYKWARGFDPALVHSVHYIAHPGLREAVSQYIDCETETNIELKKYLMQKSVVGSGILD
jgi:hypothetical protein